jgi:TPR repeat protein
MEKGRNQFLKYLQLRARQQWQKASDHLDLAVALNNPDACWHWFINDYWKGSCYNLDNPPEKAFEILTKGAKLGHPLCYALNYLLVDHADEAPSLEAEVIWSILYPDRAERVFTVSELNILKTAAEEAIHIYDPWPVFIYVKYLTNYPDLLRLANPHLITHALFLCNDKSLRIYLPPKSTNWQYRKKFNVHSIIDENYFGLPDESLSIIQCMLGSFSYHYNQVPQDFVLVYRKSKKQADAAVLAWMGCFRRKALPGLSRDTSTLIAKIVADPLKWIDTNDDNVKSSKRKIH